MIVGGYLDQPEGCNGCSRNGKAADIAELNGNIDPNISISLAYSEEERNLTASPSEFDKYLLGCNVKQEFGLEDQTASLTIEATPQTNQHHHHRNQHHQHHHHHPHHHHHQQQYQEPCPSTSGIGNTSRLVTMDEQNNGGTSYTDMTSTMRVTREATNALYPEQHLLQPSTISADVTQYLSRTDVMPEEVTGTSPTGVQPFMTTPSPSSTSDGSCGSYSSPHYSPRSETLYNPYIPSLPRQQIEVASSLTSDCSPSCTYRCPGMCVCSYNHVLPQVARTYQCHPPGQPTGTGYAHTHVSSQHSFQNIRTPTLHQAVQSPCDQSAENPSSVDQQHASHSSQHITPQNTSTDGISYHEESKIRGGKIYITYMNNTSGNYEHPNRSRHRSSPASSPVNPGRVDPPMQFPPLPHPVSFSQFFPRFDGVVAPHHPPQVHQRIQSYSTSGPHPNQHNYGGQSTMQRAPIRAALPISYPSGGVVLPAPKGFDGARLRTNHNNSSNNNNNNDNNKKREPNPESVRRARILDPVIKQMERRARKVARSLSRGIMRVKRGCTCYLCQMVFASSGHLKRHMEAHGSGRRFRCGHPYCDVSYSRQDNLKNHVTKAIHRRDGDQYQIPVSDTEDSDSEDECKFSSSSINSGVNTEPDDGHD